MNRILLIFSIVLLLPFAGYSKNIPGYFINRDGDTVSVHFKVSVGLLSRVPSFSKLQHRVVYFDQEGKRQVLRPANAREICIIHKNDTTRMLSRVNNLGIAPSLLYNDGYIFLKLEQDGPVKLFSYEQQSHGGAASSGLPVGIGMSISYDRYVIQYQNRPLIQIKGISFRRDMMNFFSDYPELAEKIEQRVYRKENIALIVKEYNEYMHGNNNRSGATQNDRF